MQATPTSVIQYFNGEKQNLIPLFQRPYTWTQANWQTLWDDLMVQYDSDDENPHFMGAIVSLPANSVPVGVSKFLIIDGQQRLATISVLLCALRDRLDARSALRIQEVYLTNPHRDADDKLKFVPTQKDRDAYKSVVLDRGIPPIDCPTGNLLTGAYNFFLKQLDEKDSNEDAVIPAKVLTTLEHCLQVVMINLGDNDDPYLIFESLNFKGELLTQADLVRNYVLMRFRHSITAGGEQEYIYTHYWRPLEELLKDNLTEYLRHYTMKDGEDIKRGGIYAAIKKKIPQTAEPETIKKEIKQMYRFGKFYAKFLSPSAEADPSIRCRIEHIRDLKVTTAYPLLLRFFDAHDTHTLSTIELERCLSLIESFVVRRSVCGVPTNALNKLFVQWAKNFPLTDHAKWLHTAMISGRASRQFPKDDEFAKAFISSPQYGRGTTRFILCRLEQSFGHKEPVDLASLTIEHLLPQDLTDEWRDMLGPDAEKTHDILCHTFGNLTLTGYNSELGNLPFDEKKKKLAPTHVELSQWVLAQSKWTEHEMRERANYLFNRANALWPGPEIPL